MCRGCGRETELRFFLPEDHQHVREVLASNRLLCIMFLVTTALCGLLLCLLRVQYAHHALLNDDILEEWSRLRDRDFNAAPKALLEDLHKDQFHGQLKLKEPCVIGKNVCSLKISFALLLIQCSGDFAWSLDQLTSINRTFSCFSPPSRQPLTLKSRVAFPSLSFSLRMPLIKL